MTGYSKTDDGSRLRLRPDAPERIIVRPGNKELLDIPAADRLLSVLCAPGGSRAQPRLVAIVDTAWRLQVRSTRAALEVPGQAFTPCRCVQRGHRLDIAKLTAAADRLRYRPAKARRVDVSRVAPDTLPGKV